MNSCFDSLEEAKDSYSEEVGYYKTIDDGRCLSTARSYRWERLKAMGGASFASETKYECCPFIFVKINVYESKQRNESE